MTIVNKAILLGTVEDEPKERAFRDGESIVEIRLKTTEEWIAKTGEKKEFSSYHRVVAKGRKFVPAAMSLSVGDRALFEGKILTRSYESQGQKKVVTEVVVGPFEGDLQALSGGASTGRSLDDEIPF